MVFAQYREPGVLMWRGFTLENFADQVLPRDRSLLFFDILTVARYSASVTRMDTAKAAKCQSTTVRVDSTITPFRLRSRRSYHR